MEHLSYFLYQLLNKTLQIQLFHLTIKQKGLVNFEEPSKRTFLAPFIDFLQQKLKKNLSMRINKACSSQKTRLILSGSVQNGFKGSETGIIINFGQKQNTRKLITRKDKPKQLSLAKETIPNLRIDKENKAPQLRLRAISSAHQRKATVMNPSRTITESIKQKMHIQPTENELIQGDVQEIVEQLKRKYILNQNHLSTFTIKREHMFSLIFQLLRVKQFSRQSPIIAQDLDTGFTFLQEKITAIGNILASKFIKEKANRNRLFPKQMIYCNHSQTYKQEITSYQSELEKLIETKEILIQENDYLLKKSSQIDNQCKLKRNEISVLNKSIQTSKTQLDYLYSKIGLLEKELKESQSFLEKNLKETAQIYDYVNEQNNKLIAMASEQYKTIEAEIYEYAVYLQCNQLASSFTYEPLSITCLTEDLENQIKNINKTMIQNQEMSAKEKSKIMRDFILEWMERFKKKDDEQKEVITFKTKCIANFVQKMKKWLDNWTLKQEYLVNLRKEFACDSNRMSQLIEDLKQSSSSPTRNESIAPTVVEFQTLFTKLQTNYKLGNSFY